MGNQDEGDKVVSGDLPSVVSTREFGSLVAITDGWARALVTMLREMNSI
jgi:hypothetical protein